MDEIEKLCLKITTLQQDRQAAQIELDRIGKLFLAIVEELNEKKNELRQIDLSIDFAQKSLVELNLS